MRNLLALIGLVVVGAAGFGWYMGWYKLSFTRSSDGNLEIKTDVDTKKVGADSTNALQHLGNAIGNQAEKAQGAKDTAPAGAPVGTPGPVIPAQGSSGSPVVLPEVAPPNLPEIPVAPNVPPVRPSAPGSIPLVPPK